MKWYKKDRPEKELKKIMGYVYPEGSICTLVSLENLVNTFEEMTIEEIYEKYTRQTAEAVAPIDIDDLLFLLDKDETKAIRDFIGEKKTLPFNLRPPLTELKEGMQPVIGGCQVGESIVYFASAMLPLTESEVKAIMDHVDRGRSVLVRERRDEREDRTVEIRKMTCGLKIDYADIIMALTYFHPVGKQHLERRRTVILPAVFPEDESQEPEQVSVEKQAEILEVKDTIVTKLTAIGAQFQQGAQLNKEQVEEVQDLVDDTIGKVGSDIHYFAALVNRPDEHEQELAEQIFKVKVLGLQTALSMSEQEELSQDQLRDIGMSALVQDISLLGSPYDSLRRQQDPLGQGAIEAIHKHPRASLDHFAETDLVNDNVGDYVIQGHERLDGSGYPSNLYGQQVLRESRILSAANMYISMMTDRNYRKGMDSHCAMMNMIYAAKAGQVDRDVVRCLLNVHSIFPVGTLVRITKTGEQGQVGDLARVVRSNHSAHTRPWIRIICDSEENAYSAEDMISINLVEDEQCRIEPYEYLEDLDDDIGLVDFASEVN